MANILQLNSTPGPDEVNRPGADTRAAGINAPGQVQQGQQIAPVGGKGQSAGGPQIGQEEAQQLQVDFESNFSAFVRELVTSETLNQDLSQLLFGDGTALLQSADPAVQKEMTALYNSISVDTPEQLLELLTTQSEGQSIYSGELFDAVREYLGSNPGQISQETMLQFLRSYQNMTQGSHLLQQMNTLSDDISALMLPKQRSEFEAMISELDFSAQNGDTAANTRVLNDKIIPYLSSYVARTHDYGAIRKAAVMFSLYAVHYENGSQEQVQKTYSQMLHNGEFRMLIQSDPEKLLQGKMASVQQPDARVETVAKSVSNLMLRGSQGAFGTQEQEKCSQVLNSMLVNESVYMPIRHMVVPFRYQGKNVMSEMWIDPNAAQDENETLSRMFIKYHIEDLGSFDLVATWQRKNVKVQLFIPDAATDLREPKRIAGDVREILQDNGLNSEVTIFRRMRELSVMEVFPDIKEKERTINLQV